MSSNTVDLDDLTLDDARKALMALDNWLAAESTAAWQASEEAFDALLNQRGRTMEHHWAAYAEAQSHTAAAIHVLEGLTVRAGRRARAADPPVTTYYLAEPPEGPQDRPGLEDAP